jgi:dolichyl-phosphate-mannose--protein O-mannosyl transferase
VLYILAALLIIYGILLLYSGIKGKVKGANFLTTLLLYAKPIVFIVIGILLLLNSFDWIFIVAGIFAIIEGALMMLDAFKKN